MPFIKRNEKNAIISIAEKKDSEHTERLAATSHELIEFIATLQKTDEIQEDNEAQLSLDSSDRELARITEDLIYLLIKKKVILFTDFPAAVQEKLLGREQLRVFVTGNESSLLDEGEII